MNNSELIIGQLDLEPRYEPWLGDEYKKRLAAHVNLQSVNNILTRVHVMGESHKGDIVDDKADVTKSTVSDHAFQRERGGAFFTKVMQILQGVEADVVNREGWHEIAFSNFLQCWMGNDRPEPTKVQLKEANRHFFGQLLITRPTVLQVLGRSWEEMPEGGVRMPNLEGAAGAPNFDDIWMYVYQSEQGLEYTLAARSVHPAGRGFDWRLANAQLNRCLAHYSRLVEYTQQRYSLVR